MKKNNYHIQLFIFFTYLFFHFDFKDAIKCTAILSKFLYFLMKAIFSRVRHPSHPGRGHGSLTCHMTQFERSDWLRSENFINIMIEYLINPRPVYSVVNQELMHFKGVQISRYLTGVDIENGKFALRSNRRTGHWLHQRKQYRLT